MTRRVNKSVETNGRAHTGTVAKASTINEVKPTADLIQKRAYELYLRRLASGQPGDAVGDWTRAEQELSLSK